MNRTFAFVTIVAVAVTASADKVVVGRVPYPQVTVSGFQGGRLTFRVSGNDVSKSVSEISQVELQGRADLNRAERLREIKPQTAAGMYRSALAKAAYAWERTFIKYRLLNVYGQTGQTARWAETWAELLASPREQVGARDLRPAKLGSKAQVASAVRSLEAALDRATDARTRLAVSNLLKRLRGESGGSAPADGDDRPGSRSDGGRPVEGGAGVQITGVSKGQLRSVETLIRSGRHAEAARKADALLKQAKASELPRAMFLAGVARMNNPNKSTRDVLQAGLLFMKVWEFYPKSAEAPQALFETARVCEVLSNPLGAQRAYEAVAGNYPDSPFAEQARKRLSEMEQARVEEADGSARGG